jgi:hypothetical protein
MAISLALRQDLRHAFEDIATRDARAVLIARAGRNHSAPALTLKSCSVSMTNPLTTL